MVVTRVFVVALTIALAIATLEHGPALWQRLPRVGVIAILGLIIFWIVYRWRKTPVSGRDEPVLSDSQIHM